MTIASTNHAYIATRSCNHDPDARVHICETS